MTKPDQDNAVKVVISPDRMRADIVIAEDDQRQPIDEMTLRAVAESRGLPIDARVDEQIRSAVEIARADNGKITHPIAYGNPPQHGTPGSFELAEHLQEARRLRAASKGRLTGQAVEENSDSVESISHYGRSMLEIVQKGDAVGVIHPPVQGIDGRDVLGRTVAANTPKPFVPEPTDDILVEPDGTVRAVRGGELHIDGEKIAITNSLEISGDVDFSVGNVLFPGDIIVHKGIKDKFSVRTHKDLHVTDVVEAADISADNDIHLARGMTARGKGSLRSGRDTHATYLDSATGNTGRHLHISRELKNCELNVGGAVCALQARVAGGRLVAAGPVEFAIAGVEAGTPTEITVARMPKLEDKLRAAADTEGELARSLEDITARMEVLNNRQNLTGDEIEELTLLNMQSAEQASKRQKLLKAIKSGLELVDRHTQPSLYVVKRIYPGVIIRIGLYILDINRPVPGPITLRLDEQGQPVAVNDGSSSRPLSSFADVKPDETAHDFSAYRDNADQAQRSAA